MTQFDESKVINTLHTDKAVVGKKYYYADNIFNLKNNIEHGDCTIGILTEIRDGLFKFGTSSWYLLYPYEEQQRRMTNKELSWWLSEKPHRELKMSNYIYHDYDYKENEQDAEVTDFLLIRENGGEWREPLI